METIVKFKKMGEKEWKDQRVIIPDFCAPYLTRYDLQIVAYPIFDSMGLFLQKKDDPSSDVVSQTIHRPSVQENVALGFKAAFEQIEALENPISTEEEPQDIKPEWTYNTPTGDATVVIENKEWTVK